MKIRSLHLDQFKKFDHPVAIEGFSGGLNLIAGPNEMGKSTLLLALRAALFERHGSKSQSIKALQPNHVQGAAPEVTVELEIDGEIHRIEKRFLRRPLARLVKPDGQVVEGNEAEVTIQSLLRLDRDTPLSLEKGSPGHFGVMLTPQRQSFDPPTLSQATRHTLEEAITVEIEQLGNQSEVDAVLANIEMAAFEIVDKRSKPKARYKDVEARLTDLDQEIEALEGDREALGDDTLALNEAEAQLRSWEDGDVLDELQAMLAHGERQRTELVRRKEIDARIAAARFRLDHLNMTRERREKREAELSDLKTELASLEQEGEGMDSRLEALEAELADQQARRQSLIDADEAVRQKRRSFEQLSHTLNQRSEIENALLAIATEVTIDLEASALDRVRLNEQPTEQSSQVVQVVDGLTIDIEDVGRIKILPKVDQLERLREHRATLDRSIADLTEALGLEGIEPEPIEVYWREVEEETAGLAANRRDLEVILKELEQTVREERTTVLTTKARRQQIETRLLALDEEVRAEEGEGDNTADQSTSALAEAESELAVALKIATSLSEPGELAALPLDQLEEDIKALRLRIEDHAGKINEAKVTIGRLGAKVAVRAGRGLDERLDDCLRRRDILGREQARYRLDAKAFSLLRATLTEAANDAKTHFHTPLAARLKPYVQSLLPDAEPEVTPEFGIAALHRGQPASERFEQLSDGTREQIAVLARLAFAQMLKEQGMPALVVLDDALVFSDQQRLARMFGILEKAAETLQIIILTCREDRFLDLKAKKLSLVEKADAA